MSERMQRLFLPMELVWEVVVCIPAEHLIRLNHSGPARSAALNFLIEKFSRPLEIRELGKELIDKTKSATEENYNFQQLQDREKVFGSYTAGSGYGNHQLKVAMYKEVDAIKLDNYKGEDLARVMYDAAINVKEKMSKLIEKMPHVSGEGHMTPINYLAILKIADELIKKVESEIKQDKNVEGVEEGSSSMQLPSLFVDTTQANEMFNRIILANFSEYENKSFKKEEASGANSSMAPFDVDITQANEMDPIIVSTGEDEIKLFRGGDKSSDDEKGMDAGDDEDDE